MNTFPLALGIRYRQEQRMEDAWAALAEAVALEPQNPATVLAFAQINYETGRPAAQLFRAAQRLAPENLAITRSVALALAAESKADLADRLLAKTLLLHPEWLDGHKALATLRTTSSDPQNFARSYEAACQAQPQNRALRLAWFHTMALTKNWHAARAIIEDGENILGTQKAFALAKIYIASESGEAAADAHMFDAVADIQDVGLDLCHIRHCLRGGRIRQAEAIGLRHINAPSASAFWPYLSLAWRLLGDPRAQWLDNHEEHIRIFDLGFSAPELDTLATTVCSLHTMKAPYLEQSVRGGTQTDRPLFFRNDLAIQKARSRVTAAIAEYIQSLPPYDASHPLLGPPRDQAILFEGSWSVRLTQQGYHACHTHPMGWISSALYVSLPDTTHMGTAPAGWISFGTPPPELGLDLKPYRVIEPIAGRLVLFPSTLWHSTVPFADGERLTIAFDVKRPIAV